MSLDNIKFLSKKAVILYYNSNRISPSLQAGHFSIINRRNFGGGIRLETKYVVEGFPRSGNSFFFNSIFYGEPPTGIVAHHVHHNFQWREAAKRDVPTVILIRNPKDAVASLVASMNWLDNRWVYLCLRWWWLFYRGVDQEGNVRLIDYREISSQLDDTVVVARRHLGLRVAERSSVNVGAISEHLTELSLLSNNRNLDAAPGMAKKKNRHRYERAGILIDNSSALAECDFLYAKLARLCR